MFLQDSREPVGLQYISTVEGIKWFQEISKEPRIVRSVYYQYNDVTTFLNGTGASFSFLMRKIRKIIFT